MLIGTRSVVPLVLVGFVEQKAVHRRPGVGLPRGPAGESDRAQVLARSPHPLLAAHDVVTARPPAFRFLILCNTEAKRSRINQTPRDNGTAD